MPVRRQGGASTLQATIPPDPPHPRITPTPTAPTTRAASKAPSKDTGKPDRMRTEDARKELQKQGYLPADDEVLGPALATILHQLVLCNATKTPRNLAEGIRAVAALLTQLHTENVIQSATS